MIALSLVRQSRGASHIATKRVRTDPDSGDRSCVAVPICRPDGEAEEWAFGSDLYASAALGERVTCPACVLRMRATAALLRDAIGEVAR